MKSFFSAELAILSQLNSVRIVLLVLHGVVVSLLALGACQDDFVSHSSFLLILPLSCKNPYSLQNQSRYLTALFVIS